jgi:hypothetical protein
MVVVATTLERIAYRLATRADVPTMAGALTDLFGQKLAGVIVGIEDPRALGDWVRGVRKPHPETERRLRDAYHVVSLLGQGETPEAIRAWFTGMNPDLEDRPPALVLREDAASVLRAARSFLAGG